MNQNVIFLHSLRIINEVTLNFNYSRNEDEKKYFNCNTFFNGANCVWTKHFEGLFNRNKDSLVIGATI